MAVALVATLVTTLAACTSDRTPPVATTSGAAGTTWTGVTHSQKSRSYSDMSAGYTADGDFWFQADADGAVTGFAVVVFRPTHDVSQLNAKVNAAKAVGSSTAGILGWPALIPNVSIQTIIGVEVAWAQPMLTIHGPISGQFLHGKLTLGWAGEQPDEIACKVTLRYLNKNDVLTEGGFKLESPWPSEAVGTDPSGLLMLATNSTTETQDGDATVSHAWTWTARRGS
ncbi:hypothetical protein Vlu01_54080 [Micromonospora lutea]|uniref:Acyl-CoA dehydrogenase n=2 Tax=Micromonospora lutea TaxID=419825 RepID=A0ABQ4J3S6_9ACTN|nr:hypothetical protein Vlu01_54080 [Micromonospora lutea]